jgi:hypothetical protein
VILCPRFDGVNNFRRTGKGSTAHAISRGHRNTRAADDPAGTESAAAVAGNDAADDELVESILLDLGTCLTGDAEDAAKANADSQAVATITTTTTTAAAAATAGGDGGRGEVESDGEEEDEDEETDTKLLESNFRGVFGQMLAMVCLEYLQEASMLETSPNASAVSNATDSAALSLMPPQPDSGASSAAPSAVEVSEVTLLPRRCNLPRRRRSTWPRR